jgi:hypothetical protein
MKTPGKIIILMDDLAEMASKILKLEKKKNKTSLSQQVICLA